MKEFELNVSNARYILNLNSKWSKRKFRISDSDRKSFQDLVNERNKTFAGQGQYGNLIKNIMDCDRLYFPVYAENTDSHIANLLKAVCQTSNENDLILMVHLCRYKSQKILTDAIHDITSLYPDLRIYTNVDEYDRTHMEHSGRILLFIDNRASARSLIGRLDIRPDTFILTSHDTTDTFIPQYMNILPLLSKRFYHIDDNEYHMASNHLTVNLNQLLVRKRTIENIITMNQYARHSKSGIENRRYNEIITDLEYLLLTQNIDLIFMHDIVEGSNKMSSINNSIGDKLLIKWNGEQFIAVINGSETISLYDDLIYEKIPKGRIIFLELKDVIMLKVADRLKQIMQECYSKLMI